MQVGAAHRALGCSVDLYLRRQDARHVLAPRCQAVLEPVASVRRAGGGGAGGAIDLRGDAFAVRSGLLQPVH